MTGVNTPRATSHARLVLGCLLAASVVLWGPQLSAAPKAPAAKVKETPDQKVAHGLLDRGQSELKQGHADSALNSFNAARQLDDSFQVETAILDATLALGKPVEAGKGYREFIEKNRATLSAEQLGISDGKLAEIAAASALLKLDASEVDADVQLDGVSVGRSPLPAPVPANPGNHQITLQKPGFVALTQQFTLVRGLNALSMKLVPEVLMGKLRVTSNSPGVIELLVNNQVVGLLPWEGTLPVGNVKLIARSNDQTSPTLDVVVERDITKPVVLELAANEGTLDVSTAASGAQISIDGRKVGVQNWHGTLPVGSHRLAMSRPGFVSQEQDVQVQAGSTESIVIGHWVALPKEATKPKDDSGMYFRLDLAGAFGKGSDGMRQECASNDQHNRPRCAARAPFGGSIGLRAGYRFKWIAPEIFGMGSFAVSYVRAAEEQYQPKNTTDTSSFYGPKRTEDYIFFRYGWAAGAGVRFTSPTPSIAATGGLGLGVFSQTGQYARNTSTSVSIPGLGSRSVPNASSSGTEHTYAPGLVFDGGVLLGSSPGTKLYLGILAIVEFAPQHSATPPIHQNPKTEQPLFYNTPGLDVVSGTQFRIGPVLGFQFGY